MACLFYWHWKHQQLVYQHLPLLSSDIVNCSQTGCSCHNEFLEKHAQQLVSTLHDCALHCFPCRLSSSSCHLAGWNDKCRKQKDVVHLCPDQPLVVKEQSINQIHLWDQALPSTTLVSPLYSLWLQVQDFPVFWGMPQALSGKLYQAPPGVDIPAVPIQVLQHMKERNKWPVSLPL